MAARPANSAALTRRWEKLSLSGRAVLTAAALHEEDLADAMLAALAPDPVDVDRLIASRWLEEKARGQWKLTTTAGNVLSLAPWSMRRTAHLSLARWQGRIQSGWTQAARHLEAGGQSDEAGRLWLSAARAYCQRHRHRAACPCFTEAIRLLPDETPESDLVAAVRDFGICAALQREAAFGIELLQRWRGRAAWQTFDQFLGCSAGILADLLARSGRHMEAAELRRAGAKHYLQAGLPSEAASELLAATSTLVWGLRFNAARETAAGTISQARACHRPDLESQGLALQGLLLGMLGHSDDGRVALHAALDVALKNNLTGLAAEAYRLLGNVGEYASCYDDTSAFRRALSYCERNDQPGTAELCRGCLSYCLFRGGRWSEAQKLATQVIKKPGALEASRVVASLVLGMIRIARGELRTGIALLEEVLRLGRRTGFGAIEIIVWAALARAHETGGRVADATACYRQMMDYWLTTEDKHDILPGLSAAVTFFTLREDRDQAAEFAAPLQLIATDDPNAEARGCALHAAAELKLLDAQPAEAAQAFEQALAAFAERNCAFELIQTGIRLGVALRLSGDEKRSVAVLRKARSRAVRLGCRPLAAQATQAMSQGAGMRVSSRASGLNGPELSPRQRDVAQHLSAGRTNKEIAATLGLSVRTVDMHVSHLFVRLDCRTRTEAAARLARMAIA